MNTRAIRLTSGYGIPALGLGTWDLRGEECVTAVRTALEMGYNHIDTADMYGNQAEIGRAIADFDRSDIFVTSKVWRDDLHYDDVVRVAEAALCDLQTDYLDLFLIHWPNRSVPLEETFRAFEQLVAQGRVRSIGVSNFDVPLLEGALQATDLPLTNNQVECHPLLRQEEVLAFCRQHDITLTAYCPLGRGAALRNEVIVSLAEKYGKSPAQVALRCLIQQGTIVIPKAGSADHMRENMAIFDFEVSPEDEQRIDRIEEEHRVVALNP